MTNLRNILRSATLKDLIKNTSPIIKDLESIPGIKDVEPTDIISDIDTVFYQATADDTAYNTSKRTFNEAAKRNNMVLATSHEGTYQDCGQNQKRYTTFVFQGESLTTIQLTLLQKEDPQGHMFGN